MSMTRNTRIIGPKGQVVIPKEIRDQAGFTEGAEVTIELRGEEVVLKRPSPPTKSYLEYFTATYAEKVKGKVDVKKIIEEEALDRNIIR
jgi:AbrB family looped-hinge helix DNA binding protein